MNIFNENVFIINESYFVKSKNLLKAEEALRLLKAEIEADPNKNPNGSKNLKALSKAFAEEFGFEEVLLTIYADKVFPNGFTFKFMQNAKVGTSIQEMAMVTSKNGIRYKNPKNKKVAIYLATQTILEGNVDEIMGVYLHEIGHNFYVSDYCYKFYKVDELIKVYSQFIKAFKKAVVKNAVSINKIVETIKMISKFNKDMKSLKKEIVLSDGTFLPDPKNFEELIRFYHTYYTKEYENMIKASEKDKEAFDKYKEKMKNPTALRRFGTIFGTVLTSPFLLFDWLLSPIYAASALADPVLLDGRMDEKFADNFAASYGYGAGLAMFFKKFEELRNQTSGLPAEEMRKKMPLYTAIKKMKLYRSIKDSVVTDVHPSDRARLNFLKAKIEHELKNAQLSKEDKAELERQLLVVIDCINDKNEVVEMYEKIEGKFKYEKKFDDKSPHTDKDIFDFDKTMQQEYIDVKKESFDITFALEEGNKYPLNSTEQILEAVNNYGIIDSSEREEFTNNLLEAIKNFDIDLNLKESHPFYETYTATLEEDYEIDQLLDNVLIESTSSNTFLGAKIELEGKVDEEVIKAVKAKENEVLNQAKVKFKVKKLKLVECTLKQNSAGKIYFTGYTEDFVKELDDHCLEVRIRGTIDKLDVELIICG